MTESAYWTILVWGGFAWPAILTVSYLVVRREHISNKLSVWARGTFLSYGSFIAIGPVGALLALSIEQFSERTQMIVISSYIAIAFILVTALVWAIMNKLELKSRDDVT